MVIDTPITKWHWTLMQFGRQLWVRASFFAVLGVATALVAVWTEHLIPIDIPGKIGADAVDNILNILASSMLAVTTFSLSVMVTSYGAAAQNVTPRATRLLMQDNTTQTVLSTFVGSFLFSLVGIITLGMGAYGGSGRVVLFIATLAVIAIVVVTILRWIDHLSRFGRVGDTTERVERAAADALSNRRKKPHLGGRARDRETSLPDDALAVCRPDVGYVMHIDMRALNAICDECSVEIYLDAIPGAFVDFKKPLAHVDGRFGNEQIKANAIERIAGAFSIGHMRSFDQDPRFGVSVLSEIASKALSPAINDTGTAIDVIGRGVRLLSIWSEFADGSDEKLAEDKVDFPGVFVPPIMVRDLFDDLFTPIAREGAGLVEIQLRLQKAFASLAQLDGEFEDAARHHSKEAMQRAKQALVIDADKQRLDDLVQHLGIA